MDLEWMRGLTDTESAAEIVSTPWKLIRRGSPYAVVTDASMLVAVKTDNEFPEAEGDVARILQRVLPEEVRGTWIGFNEFKQWVGPVPSPEEKTCPECKGKKTLVCSACEGTGEEDAVCDLDFKHLIWCRECKGLGTFPCDTCGERGTFIDKDDFYIGRIEGLTFNLRRIARAIEHLEAPSVLADVRPDADYGRLILATPEWLVVVVQVKGVQNEDALPSFSFKNKFTQVGGR